MLARSRRSSPRSRPARNRQRGEQLRVSVPKTSARRWCCRRSSAAPARSSGTLGATVMTFVRAVTSDLARSWLLYQGLIFVLVMLFMPTGSAGWSRCMRADLHSGTMLKTSSCLICCASPIRPPDHHGRRVPHQGIPAAALSDASAQRRAAGGGVVLARCSMEIRSVSPLDVELVRSCSSSAARSCRSRSAGRNWHGGGQRYGAAMDRAGEPVSSCAICASRSRRLPSFAVTPVVRRGRATRPNRPDGAGESRCFNLIWASPRTGDPARRRCDRRHPAYLVDRRGLSRSFQIHPDLPA